MAGRYAAWERKEYFLRVQFNRVSDGTEYRKSRILKACWSAGSSIGLPLPLIGARVRSPGEFINLLNGPARRSIAARFFVGDLDIAAYSGNWDCTHRVFPRRACAYCYLRYNGPSYVEDEWHVLLVCPLYSSFRSLIPFDAVRTRVEGHPLQGNGCAAANLKALLKAVLGALHPNDIAGFLVRAIRSRRQHRAPLR